MPKLHENQSIEVSLAATLHPSSQVEALQCTIYNINLSGMFVHAQEKLAVGQICPFAIQIRPGRLSIRGTCEVVGTQAAREPTPSLPAGMDLRFVSLADSEVLRLQRFIEHHIAAKPDRVTAAAPPDPTPMDHANKTERLALPDWQTSTSPETELGCLDIDNTPIETMQDLSEFKADQFDLDGESAPSQEPPGVTFESSPYDEQRAFPRVLLGYKVKMQYDSIAQFIDEYAINISTGGMFVRTNDAPAPGTQLGFEILLDDDSVALKGIGEVAWCAQASQADEKPRVPGVGIRFIQLDPQSEKLIQQIVESSLHNVGQALPIPEVSEKTAEPVGWQEVFGALVHAIELARLPSHIDIQALYAQLGQHKEDLFDGKTVRLATLFTLLLSQQQLTVEQAALPIVIFFLIQACLPIEIQLPEMIEKYEGFGRLLTLADKRIGGLP